METPEEGNNKTRAELVLDLLLAEYRDRGSHVALTCPPETRPVRMLGCDSGETQVLYRPLPGGPLCFARLFTNRPDTVGRNRVRLFDPLNQGFPLHFHSSFDHCPDVSDVSNIGGWVLVQDH